MLESEILILLVFAIVVMIVGARFNKKKRD